MRIYNTVILIFLIPGYKCDLSVNASSNYSDTCEYSTGHYQCGDICLRHFGKCSCGDEVIGGWKDGPISTNHSVSSSIHSYLHFTFDFMTLTQSLIRGNFWYHKC